MTPKKPDAQEQKLQLIAILRRCAEIVEHLKIHQTVDMPAAVSQDILQLLYCCQTLFPGESEMVKATRGLARDLGIETEVILVMPQVSTVVQ